MFMQLLQDELREINGEDISSKEMPQIHKLQQFTLKGDSKERKLRQHR
jgi:hypothetical protein